MKTNISIVREERNRFGQGVGGGGTEHTSSQQLHWKEPPSVVYRYSVAQNSSVVPQDDDDNDGQSEHPHSRVPRITPPYRPIHTRNLWTLKSGRRAPKNS